MLAPAALSAAGLLDWVGALGVLHTAVLCAFRLLSGLRVWVLGGGRAVGPQLGAWAGGCARRGGGGPLSVRPRVWEAASRTGAGASRGDAGPRRGSGHARDRPGVLSLSAPPPPPPPPGSEAPLSGGLWRAACPSDRRFPAARSRHPGPGVL